MGKRNYIDIDWPELFKPIPGADREKYNWVRVNREVIPIIFVPGIMGSRLRNKKTGQSVWDPDREIMCMLRYYGGFWNTPAQRKRMLIGRTFNPEFLTVDCDNSDHNGTFDCPEDPGRADRGWGGVYWGSYGKFLEQLQNHPWEMPVTSSGEQRLKEMVGKCFEFPVYAFGYNWTDTNFNSGEKLAWEIDQIIWRYGSKGRKCKYVILISHSMGGLVCRSACKLHNAERNVLGVIHGVQPTTGAPAAYWRMKAGFERTGGGILKTISSTVSAWVLGTNGEEVTCILGNAPGGLELLPNKHYSDNKGNGGWLRIPLGGQKEKILPSQGDPYEEIYKANTNKFWRLITPEWLAPTDDQVDREPTSRCPMSPWEHFIECIDKAKEFHEKLIMLHHNNTYHFYSGNVNTVDHIEFAHEKLTYSTRFEGGREAGSDPYVEIKEPTMKPCTKGDMIAYVNDENEEISNLSDETETPNVVSMSHPNTYAGGGDGTVPESSASSLEEVMGSFKIHGIDHQVVFSNHDAADFVFNALKQLAIIRIKQERTLK